MERENWFADINSQFPFPFNLLPDTVNWNLAMWAELVLPALLIVGRQRGCPRWD